MKNFKQICRGNIISFNKPSPYKHFIGGEHKINGAECPNCKKPLILHLSLDSSDTSLNLNISKLDCLPLLYCMRCSLSFEDFQYRVLSDETIQITKANKGEVLLDEWNEEVGTELFQKREISLEPISERLQVLYDKLNSNLAITDAEKSEISSYTKQHANPEVGAYPIVDVINQVGGLSFLSQRLDDPTCLYCQSGMDNDMYFLASLTNDKKENFKITYEGTQIVFFFCPKCHSVHVQHST